MKWRRASPTRWPTTCPKDSGCYGNRSTVDFLRRLRGDQASRTGLVAVVFLIAIVAGGSLVQRGASGGPPTAYEAARLYDNVRSHIARDYVDSIGDEQLYRLSVDGLLHELGDPYTRFLTADRVQRLS